MGARDRHIERHAYRAGELAALVAALGADGALCPLVVKGTSMVPTLREGRDTVYLRAVDADEPLHIGDIVFFWRGSQVVLHRIVGLAAPDILRINGDGQLWCEEVPRARVFAVVERVKRGSRVLPMRTGIMRIWGALWLRCLPIRSRLWRLPAPIKRAVRRVGSLVRGGGGA